MITIIGITILFIGYTIGIFMLVIAYMAERKELKRSKEIDSQDKIIQETLVE